MSGVTRSEFGDTLPLNYISNTGDTTLFPQAEGYDSGGSLIFTEDLAHVAKGIYTSTGETMPNDSFVVVLYISYDDAGHTTESVTPHLRDADVFSLQSAISTGPQIASLVWEELAASHLTAGTTGLNLAVAKNIADILLGTKT